MRRIGVWVVLCAVVWPAMGQLSGRWETRLSIVPTLALEKSVLEIAYQVAPEWKITSVSTFTAPGLTGQAFGILGQMGPLLVSGMIDFNPQQVDEVIVTYPEGCDPQTESVTLTAPAYKSAWFKTELTFAGLGIALELHHWAFPYTEDYFDIPYYWPCCPPQTQSYTLMLVTVLAGPVTLTTSFADCCAGITFDRFIFELKGASFCCGLKHNAVLEFNKLGFTYITFSIEIPLCCGISLEISIKFTVTSKTVSVKPKWVGLGQACFEVYGDVVWDEQNLQILGLAIYGYKLHCDFGPCTYVDFLTALDPQMVEQILEKDIFEGSEFEYLKLGFCGPGCCGGTYTLSVAVFFQPSGTLFGLSRFLMDLSAPVMSNFSLLLSLGLSVSGGGPTTLGVGWVLTF